MTFESATCILRLEPGGNKLSQTKQHTKRFIEHYTVYCEVERNLDNLDLYQYADHALHYFVLRDLFKSLKTRFDLGGFEEEYDEDELTSIDAQFMLYEQVFNVDITARSAIRLLISVMRIFIAESGYTLKETLKFIAKDLADKI